MRRYIPAPIAAGAGENHCLPRSGSGPGRKTVKEVWIACATAGADTMVDDFRVYLDTERLADIPKEMIWGIPAATIDLPRRIIIPLDVVVEVNEVFKVAVLSDASLHPYSVTVVYEM